MDPKNYVGTLAPSTVAADDETSGSDSQIDLVPRKQNHSPIGEKQEHLETSENPIQQPNLSMESLPPIVVFNANDNNHRMTTETDDSNF